MSEERGSLGKASLELTADTTTFRRNVDEAHASSDDLTKALEAIAAAGEFAERGLARVKMGAGQATESRITAEEILSGVRGIGEESAAAARELDRVRITDRQAAESALAGEEIKHNVAEIGDQADKSKRKLEEMRLAGAGGGHQSVGGTTLPLLAAGIGAAALTAPAAGPALLGLLGAIPALGVTAAGALGTVMLAFRGVGAAIGGNKKAFDALGPAQQQFVMSVRSLDGLLDHLTQVAGKNLFPGLTEALHSALSPGTVGMVTQAIAAFARAIGQAGAQWGRYFGSPEFQRTMGPLLQAGAHDIGTFSAVMLKLVDSLLVLGRAAIPFTNWLGSISEKGAKWVDTFLHARDATGQLAGAMYEAQVSLTLVGRLVESLARVVGSLGSALYPVSKVAVKDLTDGLNWLAHVIDDNKTQIQQIVGGALSALKTALHVIVPVVADLAKGLELVVQKMGGWHTAFLLILGGLLAAKFVALGKTVYGVAGDIAKAAVKVAIKIGLITTAEAGIGPAAVAAEAETASAFAGIGAAAVAAIPYIALLVTAIAGAKVAWDTFQGTMLNDAIPKPGSPNPHAQGTTAYDEWQAGYEGKPAPGHDAAGRKAGEQSSAYKAGERYAKNHPDASIPQAGFGSGPGSKGKQAMLSLAKQALGTPYLWGGSGPGGFDCSGLVMWAFSNGLNVQLPHSTYAQAKMGKQVSPSNAKVGDIVFTNYGEGGKAGPGHEGLIVGYTKNGQPIIEAAPHKGAKVQTYTGYGAFTGGSQFTVRDLTAKTAPTPNSSDIWGTPPAWTSGTTTAKKPPTYHVPAALTDTISKRWTKFSQDTTKHNLDLYLAAVDAGEKLAKAHGLPTGTYVADIARAKSAFQKKIAAAQAAAAAQTINQLAEQTAGPEQALKLAQASGASPQIILVAQQGLLAAYQTEAAALKQKMEHSTGKAKAEYKAALGKVNQAIQSTEDSVVSTLQSIAQAAQQKVSTYAGRVEQDVLSQFNQQTQDYIDTQLGPEFFQGTNPDTGAPLQTPAEAQLAAMQAQDQSRGLTDQLAQDQASGASAAQLAADQRAIDENNLATQATRERQQADADYAKAVKTYTDQRTLEEGKLTDALDAWASGLTDGTSSLTDLTGIAGTFGVTLTGLTDPTTGIGYDFGLLSTAATDAATALTALTAAANSSSSATPAPSASGIDAIVAAAHSSGTIGMAEGGFVASDKPQRIVMGEKGYEEAIFSGAGRSFSDIAADDSASGPGTPPDLVAALSAIVASSSLFSTSTPVHPPVIPTGDGTSGADLPAVFHIGSEEASSPAVDRGFTDRLTSTSTGPSGDIVLEVDSRELARANAEGLSRDRHAVHITAKAVKPALARVTAIAND